MSTLGARRLGVDKVVEVVKATGQETTIELDQVGVVRAWNLLMHRTKLDRLAAARVMKVENPMGAVRVLEISPRAERAAACLVEVLLKLPAQLRLQVLLKQPSQRHKPLQMQLNILKLSRLRRNPLRLNQLKHHPLKLNSQKFPNLILPSPLMLRTQVTRTRPLRTLIHQIQEAAQPVVGTQAVEIQE
jgi:hypothetical protein